MTSNRPAPPAGDQAHERCQMLRTELPPPRAPEIGSPRDADVELVVATILSGLAIILATVIVPAIPA
jgi:hypothetical protein